MDRLEYVLRKFPSFYSKEVQDAKIRALVKAFTDELSLLDNQLDRVVGMASVDTTYDADLDTRWGGLLNIPRVSGEDSALYRNRLKTSVSNLSGGTIGSIKYAVAVALGINNNPAAIDKQISVIDAWEYTGQETVDKSKGSVVVTVDLNSALLDYSDDISTVVSDVIQYTKASGVNVQLLFYNYRVMTYAELDSLAYLALSGLQYDKLGG